MCNYKTYLICSTAKNCFWFCAGLKVVGTAGSDEGLRVVKEAGADIVVNHR